MNEIPKLNIKTLAYLAGNGNKSALKELLERESKVCRAFFRKHNLPPNDIQDLVQNVLIKITKNIQNLRIASTYPKWAKTIARNELYDYLRLKRKSKFQYMTNNELAEISKNIPNNTTNPLDEILVAELKNKVKNSIKFLPDEYKKAIIMRDIAGLSYSKIAEISKINLGTVKSRISRAREKLKKIVEPYLSELWKITLDKGFCLLALNQCNCISWVNRI